MDDFVRGELTVGLLFEPSPSPSPTSGSLLLKGSLHVHIKSAQDLPEMNMYGLADASVKCFLLPDHSSSSGKRSTHVVCNSLKPVWGEKFGYQQLSVQDLLQERVLELTVWDHHKNGTSFIGGLRLGGAPGRSAQHRDWMDCMGEEVWH